MIDKLQTGKRSKHEVSFDIGWLYCACLFYDGYSDWRLPTSEEFSKMEDDIMPPLDMDQSDFHLDVRRYVTPVRTCD